MSDRRDEHPETRPDAISDPARDDEFGSDWADEGGASPQGPATSTGAADDRQDDDADQDDAAEDEDDAPSSGSSAEKTQPPITLDPPD